MASTFSLNMSSTCEWTHGRYMYISLSQEKDIANNRSKVTWTLYSATTGGAGHITIAPTSIVINGTTVYSIGKTSYTYDGFPSTVGSYSDVIYLNHDSNGNLSVSVSLSTNVYEWTPYTNSGTWTLDSIPRQATITSAPGFSDIDNPTISYSNPAGNSVSSLEACISLDGSWDDVPYRAISKTGSSYTFNLTNTERETLRNSMPGSTWTRQVGYFLRTVIGGNTLYSTAYKTFMLLESDTTKPSVSVSYSANNGSLPSTFNGMYIQGKSKVNVSISASGKYNATISSYSTTIAGSIYTSASFTSGYIQTTGATQINSVVTDSRGFTNYPSPAIFIYVYQYNKPSIVPISGASEVKCYRSNSDGTPNNSSTSIWIKAKKSYSNVNNLNSCTLRYRTRLSSSSSWSGWATLSTSNDQYNALISGTFPITSSYVVEIGVVDTIGETSSILFDIPTEDVPFHLGEGGKSVGIGRYADTNDPESVKIGWKTVFDDPIYMNGVGFKFDSNLSSLPNVPSGVSWGRYIQFIGAEDNYYLLLASTGRLFIGVKLNSSSTILWVEK